MGKISDRHGRQNLLFGGMFVCALFFRLIPWFQSFSMLLLLAAIFGLGEAVVTSSAAALVADFAGKTILVRPWEPSARYSMWGTLPVLFWRSAHRPDRFRH
jgi:MFS family permease